ncbi:C40 family peptidase [Tuberibacillus sp. Marseille-P3662]|uniref:C40 family peptidase n=1 Tax=Tuberibacillus sp. Marseille-P3662 TaxID=1965358 RepID=UPI000A1CA32C|nr:peptidoglycan-binding protein [Tuberibacillus sp. Marseille-P3662]
MTLRGNKLIVSSFVAASIAFLPHLNADAAENMNTQQIISKWEQGNDVRTLQKALDKRQFYTGSIDGIYGPITTSAVRKFQRSNQLQVDGIAGPNTLGAMFNGQSNADNSSSSSRYLDKGDRGANVRKVQKTLDQLGYLNGSVDGIFGPVTENAVEDFQSAQGLAVDGIVGPNTHGALQKSDGQAVEAVSYHKNSSLTDNIIADAKKYIGVPYKWSGESPSGFDCSGLTQYVFAQNGVDIPRTTSQQWSAGQSVSNRQPGDLVFFETYRDGPSHVGIYIGNSRFIQSGSSSGVKISNLDSSYWGSRYIGAKRF